MKTNQQKETKAILEMIEEKRILRNALAFARGVILSGENWSSQCDEIINGALELPKENN